MKIEMEKLKSYLKKIKLNGTNEVQEIVLNFDNNGLNISTLSPTNVIKAVGLLKRIAFSEYEEIGKFAVSDLPTIIKILDKFSGNIEIIKTENSIIIKGSNKEVTIELLDLQFIQEQDSEIKLVYDDCFKVPIDDLHGVVDDNSVNKEFKLVLETVVGGLKIYSEGKYKFKKNIVCESKLENKVKLLDPFIDGIINLNSDVLLSVKSDYPIKIEEKTDESDITLIIAPSI